MNIQTQLPVTCSLLGNTEIQTQSHPTIRTFLNWLQQYEYQIQGRCIQLAVGRPAKERRAEYVKIEKDMAQVKLKYGLRLDKCFAIYFLTLPGWTASAH